MKPVFVVALAFTVLAGESNACPLVLPETTIFINGHRLVVELALTSESRACGLSHRASLPQNRGMLFVYRRAEVRTFWMKDTLLPLSIAFLDHSGTIINIERMVPNQTKVKYRSSLPAQFALEVHQGWFKERGIRVGDRVIFRLPAQRGSN
jgi:uncharacterized membrane protein (UPF0127 family)